MKKFPISIIPKYRSLVCGFPRESAIDNAVRFSSYDTPFDLIFNSYGMNIFGKCAKPIFRLQPFNNLFFCFHLILILEFVSVQIRP